MPPTFRHACASYSGLQTVISNDSSPGPSAGPTNIRARNANSAASPGNVAGSGSRSRLFNCARTGHDHAAPVHAHAADRALPRRDLAEDSALLASASNETPPGGAEALA